MKRRALVALALLVATGACKAPAHTHAFPTTSTTPPNPVVRIGVWTPPDPSANTYGGAAVRELVDPQLFRATPGGQWQASLAQPGSDATDRGNTSARFRLRANAKWSDGTPITAADLRRTLDARFVTAVDDPGPDGTIVVHFTQALPGWRRLWSGLDAIAPPHDGVYGGPYKVGAVTSGLETILLANDAYYGATPRIREVHLVLAPDPEIAARLMERGELDVIAPPAFTGRTQRLRRIPQAHVLVGDPDKGGWSAALLANPSRLNLDQRLFLLAYANGPRFADVLLHDEATATGQPVTAPTPKPSFGSTPAITAPDESEAGSTLVHAMQRQAHKAGFDFDVRPTEFDRVLAAYASADYDVLFRLEPTEPTECWTCRYANLDAGLVKAADAGDTTAQASIEQALTAQADVLPLWRERPEAAVRDGVDGVSLNGFDVLGAAWNIEAWHWSR